MTDTRKPWTPLPNNVSQLPALRALYRSFAAVDRTSARHIESLGLTQPRFDVLSALGDTPGMTVKELCDTTLITKGTALHVIGSLEQLGLVERSKGEQDLRKTMVALTPKGQALYEDTFLVHVDFMKRFFEKLSPEERTDLIGRLGKVEDAFSGAD